MRSSPAQEIIIMSSRSAHKEAKGVETAASGHEKNEMAWECFPRPLRY